MNALRSHRFFVVAVSSVAIFVDSVFVGLIAPLLPVYAERLKLSTVEVAVLFAVYAFVMLPACPASAFFCSRYGPRKVLLVGLICMVGSALLFTFGDDSFALLVLGTLGFGGAL